MPTNTAVQDRRLAHVMAYFFIFAAQAVVVALRAAPSP